MKSIALKVLASDFGWPMVLLAARMIGSNSLFEAVFQRVLYERSVRKRAWIESFIRKSISDLKVTCGPFSGMQYPKLEAAGSMLAPKLLGCYETEIADLFVPSALADFDVVIDVGCAEGFYAVGIARSKPNCIVNAYDISPDAQGLCQALAEANGVSDRVRIDGLCGDSEFKSCAGKRTLVVSDCEGAEMDLFHVGIVKDLAMADLIIEVHEHLGADLSVLQKRFDATHTCEVVRGLMDIDRLKRYRHPLVDRLPDRWRVLLFAECRSRGNCWLVARSRSATSQ